MTPQRPALVQLRALPPEPLGRRVLLHKIRAVVEVAVTQLPVRAFASVVKGLVVQARLLVERWCPVAST